MSSSAYVTPLTLEPGASPALRTIVSGLYGLAACGLLWLPAVWIVVGMTVLVVSGLGEWRRQTGCAVCLRWQADGYWEQPGVEEPACLLASTFLSRWLVVLALDDGRRVRRWAIPRDAVPAAQWRRLRARLRVEGSRLELGA
ncbi:MAG: protein YgfX [Halofilum sp. (in: g-proteobacteria)]